MNIKEHLQLYLVMGSGNCVHPPEHVLQEAIRGGVTCFQLREKVLTEEVLETARVLRAICKEHGVPFIVNDHVELALELDADGLHVGQEDGNLTHIRSAIGNRILGISTHSVEEAKAAVEQGADYIGVGPMYATSTKHDTRDVVGPAMVEAIRQAGVTLPIVGIGGITSVNASFVTDAGADGAAVISAVSASSDPKQASENLYKAVSKISL